MSCGVNEFSERNTRTENLYGSHHFLCCLHQKLFSQLRTNPPPVVMICWDPRKTLKSFFLLPCQRAGNSHAHPLQWVAVKEWRAVINLGGLPASAQTYFFFFNLILILHILSNWPLVCVFVHTSSKRVPLASRAEQTFPSALRYTHCKLIFL